MMHLKNGQRLTSFNEPTHGVVAVVPAYNESRFIGSVVLGVLEFVDTVIVVDDGSQDATAAIAAKAGAHVVQHATNGGKGEALNTGFSVALGLGAKVVVTIDADGQHRPQEMLAVAAPVLAGVADVVIGSRYVRARSKVPRHRVWGHRLFNWITATASGLESSDSQSGYRAFSAEALRHRSFSSKSFSVESEMQFWANELDLRLVEVPITISYNDPPKRNVIRHGLIVLNGILHLAGQYRPLLVFGLLGSSILLVSLFLGIHVLNIYQQSQELALGYALIVGILFVTGSGVMSTGFILHSVRGLILEFFDRVRHD